MHTQKNLFQVTNGGILNYYESTKITGKTGVYQTVNLTDDLKAWVDSVADAVSTTTGDHKYGASTVIREAIAFYRVFYKIRHKMLQCRKKIYGFLQLI